MVAIYVLDDETPGDWRSGGATRWWLHHSLATLDVALRARGARLLLLRGRAGMVLPALAAQIGATVVHALHHYEPFARRQQAEVGERLDLRLYDGLTLLPPDTLKTGGGGRYLYNYKPSEFDLIGLSEHHFMVAEIAGDRLFFAAITHTQRLIDCGVVYRTADAATKPDDPTTKWLADCDAGRAQPRATR